MSTRTEAIGLAGLLLVLSAAQGAVLYFVTDAMLRLVLGILLLAPIIFAGSRLGVVDHFLNLVSGTVFARRQRRLRATVDQLLDEVRRLNAIAVDGKRGVRSPDTTTELLDSHEARIQELVARIRDTAGEEHGEPPEIPPD